MIWEWYRHLAQHPLVSPVYTADLSGLGGATLLVCFSYSLSSFNEQK